MDIAAYGWEYPQWAGVFYPEDMPEQWRLDYYCNEFSALVVPSGSWCGPSGAQVEAWVDGLGEQTRVYLELPADIDPAAARAAAVALRGRLAGFVAPRRPDTSPGEMGAPVGVWASKPPVPAFDSDVGWCWPEAQSVRCQGGGVHCAWIGAEPLTPMGLRRIIEGLTAAEPTGHTLLVVAGEPPSLKLMHDAQAIAELLGV
jgi:hypothetical protein